MKPTDLANQIEQTWMEYNAAVVNRLHPEKFKTRLANTMINGVPEILKALRAYEEPVQAEQVVVVDEAGAKPKKVRK